MFGFLYRAVLGSVRKLMRGEISLGDLLANWTAALKLPFMHLGLAKDIWGEFGDRYLEVEKGVRSTFFVIPFANQPGAPLMVRRRRFAVQATALKISPMRSTNSPRRETRSGSMASMPGAIVRKGTENWKKFAA
jgi:hypothetical protein